MRETTQLLALAVLPIAQAHQKICACTSDNPVIKTEFTKGSCFKLSKCFAADSHSSLLYALWDVEIIPPDQQPLCLYNTIAIGATSVITVELFHTVHSVTRNISPLILVAMHLQLLMSQCLTTWVVAYEFAPSSLPHYYTHTHIHLHRRGNVET